MEQLIRSGLLFLGLCATLPPTVIVGLKVLRKKEDDVSIQEILFLIVFGFGIVVFLVGLVNELPRGIVAVTTEAK